MIIPISEKTDIISSHERTEIIGKEICFHFIHKEFLKLLYHRLATCIIITRNATNYLMYWPIPSIDQLHHTPHSRFHIK